MLIYKLLG